MKTSELSGAALDWAVAKCEQFDNRDWLPDYSIDWAAGGPIIEREGLGIGAHLDREEWIARDYWGMHEQQGITPLIAAMRCYVASKLGGEIEIPADLDS